ncbi:putative purine permease 10 [Forsythia ovata]|uniref:Probable purine permease n=1 Tax=Forsythia ovata TaxID=205694 RepID=A0ABD1W6Q9_9LAMI
MDAIEEVELPTRVKESNSDDTSQREQLTTKKHLGWWLRIFLYTVFLLAGQSAATLLGRLYYDKGGNSKWMATLVQSAGFPILIPLLLFFPQSSAASTGSSKSTTITALLLLYLFFGILLAGDNMMYSYGLLYLPVSTYSLVCATQLAFNALFSFLLNSQKFTALTFNSLVLLTISASLLAVHPDSTDNTTQVSKSKYIIGFLCTLGASATYSLYLSLLELSFKKIIKRETFDAVLDMQIYPSFVATCASIVGLFASGEWANLGSEIKGFQEGRVSYVMILVWTAITWQISSVGLLGLIFEKAIDIVHVSYQRLVNESLYGKMHTLAHTSFMANDLSDEKSGKHDLLDDNFTRLNPPRSKCKKKPGGFVQLIHKR